MFFPDLDTETLKTLYVIAGCLFFSFTGSYLQELLNIYRGIQRLTRLHKILIGTIIGTLFYMTIVYRYFKDSNITVLVIVNVFSGSIGYEIFRKCSSLDDFKGFANDVHDIIKNLFGIDNAFKSSSSKEEKKDSEDDE